MSRMLNQKIREFILDHLEKHPKDIVNLARKEFQVTRETVHAYIRRLMEEGLVEAQGKTRSRTYRLKFICDFRVTLPITPGMQEDVVWREHVMPKLKDVPGNVLRICNYGFTEMLNNAIDHSRGSSVEVRLKRTYKKILMWVHDDGVGIFEKIKQDFNLEDRRHAILELSKGKLTSDASRHSGEGIFFTSRMFSGFIISSLDLDFVKFADAKDGFLFEIETPEEETSGTNVVLELDTGVDYAPKDIFDRYTDDDQRFSKTVIPLKLAKYEGEQLVSRSQARRILNRLDRFSEVMLDFEGISEIGQGFADEMFRVYAKAHPEIGLYAFNADQQVLDMIRHVKTNAAVDTKPV